MILMRNIYKGIYVKKHLVSNKSKIFRWSCCMKIENCMKIVKLLKIVLKAAKTEMKQNLIAI